MRVAVSSRSSGSPSTVAALMRVDRDTHLLLEQGEQELVLAVEVLVEAAQRLARPVDDLLHGEVDRSLLGDDLARRVEELLDPRRRSLPGGPGRAFDRPRRATRASPLPASSPVDELVERCSGASSSGATVASCHGRRLPVAEIPIASYANPVLVGRREPMLDTRSASADGVEPGRAVGGGREGDESTWERHGTPARASPASRTHGCSPATAPSSTTSSARGCSTPASSAARTPAPASSPSTPRRRSTSPASTPSSPPPT